VLLNKPIIFRSLRVFFSGNYGVAIALLMFALCWTPLASAKQNGDSTAVDVKGVEIRRTTDGIPHLRAKNWRDLGMGIGFVQAQDALCTLADAFVTFEGKRAWFFGADSRPARDSTFGQPTNIDLDFFFRAFADKDVLQLYRAENVPELDELVRGFAAGYNKYLMGARRKSAVQHTCLAAPWVREITGDDIYRRMYALQIAAGYARFIPEIVDAMPAKTSTASTDNASLQARLAYRIGEQAGMGSNMFAFGGATTGENNALLFANPHWFWGGPDRFYQMHLTIPGQINVAGVSMLGIPLIMLGFNENIAWTHTVSAARRFGLFDLTLDSRSPTQYQLDGDSKSMTARTISVEVKEADGKARAVTRTFYETHFGPVVDLRGHDAAFGWSATHALAIRDVNTNNFRIFSNYLLWNRARSLNEFVAIQRHEAAMPWVNTAAIARGDGRVWYGDVGAVPNVPDTLRKSCATSLATAFATVDPFTPFLDGSRTACNWRTEVGAVQAGAMLATSMPSLLREDYVANMNDSYWLTNIHQPLEGYPLVMGGEREPLSLRGRLGHRMALDLIEHEAKKTARDTASFSRDLMREVLIPRAYSAELYKTDLLAKACAQKQIDVGPACDVLRKWTNKAEADDRGALLWEAFWMRLSETEDDSLSFREKFSAAAPLDTPSSIVVSEARAAQALAATVVSFSHKGWPLDADVGSQRYVATNGHHEKLYGGCDAAGYFVVTCHGRDAADEKAGSNTVANTYLQVVRFDTKGVDAHTLLAHGQTETAIENGVGDKPVIRYARKAWLRFPFSEQDIARDPQLKRSILSP
jgi:acyl-homoserine-lactone acylase